MVGLCWVLQVKCLRTSVYHPQIDGLMEQFNQTLKRMLFRQPGDVASPMLPANSWQNGRARTQSSRGWNQWTPVNLQQPGKHADTQLYHINILKNGLPLGWLSPPTPQRMVVQQRTYQVPEAHRQAIEEEVERMLRDGIIEESTSNQSSPIMVVPKPDVRIPLQAVNPSVSICFAYVFGFLWGEFSCSHM